MNNLAYQESYRTQMIGGKVVMMSPRPTVNHYQISFNIANLLANYLQDKPCRVFADGVDLYLTETDRFVPDGMVVCDKEKIKPDGIHGAPDMVVEVLSPSTGRHDRGHKMEVYGRCGVQEYWIVSPESKTVEIYRQQQGSMEFFDSRAVHREFELKDMNEKELAEATAPLYCSLFPDLPITLEQIFSRVE